MKIVAAAALVAGALLLLSSRPALAQDTLDDAMALLETDPVAALPVLETLAAAGDAEAMNAVAVVIDRPPDGIVADKARALLLWEQAVEAGSDAARLNLGMQRLLNPDETDDARAVAMLGDIRDARLTPYAAYPLGRAYLFGTGVERNLERGSRLMETAVEAAPENADAQFLLGRAYQNGWGMQVDAPAAFRHLKIAADAGDARAQWNVGMMLLNGDGATTDAVMARRYVRAAAESGYEAGMISMAVMLATGEGGPTDAAEARVWYGRAVDTGSAHALRGLAGMLITGEGGAVDLVTGAAYLDLAAKGGDAQAVQLQGRFADQLASLNRGEVEAVKAQWLREHGVPR